MALQILRRTTTWPAGQGEGSSEYFEFGTDIPEGWYPVFCWVTAVAPQVVVGLCVQEQRYFPYDVPTGYKAWLGWYDVLNEGADITVSLLLSDVELEVIWS